MRMPPAMVRTQGLAMRRSRWGAVAVILLAVGLFLVARREREQSPSRAPATFPRLRDEEVARMHKRATLALPPVLASATTEAPPKRDPLLVALPVKPDSPVVVFEVNALRYSRLGERFLSCVQAQDQNRFADIVRETGIDPLKDIDRVAFLGDAVVVSGQFDRARWDQLGGPAEPYGQAGHIYAASRMVVGNWRDQIVVLSSRAADVRTAIDQLEGRAPVPETGLREDMSYGEIYGLVPGAAARRALGGGSGDGGLTDRIASLASRIELHVDAMQNLAAVVRVRGDDASGLSDVARQLGAALTAARANAQATGNSKLFALLEEAAVRPGEREFSVQLAVPGARVEELLEACKIFQPPPGALSAATR
jgi:hypothetical protein